MNIDELQKSKNYSSNEELNEDKPIPSEGDEIAVKKVKPSRGGSNTTSPVWKYFKLNINNPIQATCLMCGTLMSRGGVFPSRCGTTNLRRHLSFAHGIILPSRKKPQQAVKPISQPDAPKGLTTVKPKKKTLVNPPVPEPANLEYEVCLRWKSYHSNMQSVLPNLLNNEHFVDVTLACEGRSIKCHRLILSCCSSYFEEILCQAQCQHPIIIIKDLRFQELRTLVDFMYKGEVYVPQEHLPSLLIAADALKIKGLSTSPNINDPSNEDVQLTNEEDILTAKPKESSPLKNDKQAESTPGTSHSTDCFNGSKKSPTKSRSTPYSRPTSEYKLRNARYKSKFKPRNKVDALHQESDSADEDTGLQNDWEQFGDIEPDLQNMIVPEVVMDCSE